MDNGVPSWLIVVGLVIALGACNERLQNGAKRDEALGCVKTAQTLEQAKDCVYGVN